MTIEWNIILWCLITLGVLVFIFVIGYYIMTARMMKKRRQQVLEINENLKVGKKVMIAGMLGKIVKVDGDYVHLEIAKDTVITASRYAVQEVFDK